MIRNGEVIDSGLLKDTKPNDSYECGTVAANASGGYVNVTLDDGSTAVCTVCCDVRTGNRVLTLLHGKERICLTQIGGTKSLFSGSADGATNVTLSEALTHFPYLTIYYADNDGYSASFDVCTADCVINTASASASKYTLQTMGGITQSYIKRRIVYFYSTTELRNISTGYVEGATATEQWVSATNQIVIKRIIGHY